MSELQKFYKDKVIFLTGASGFVGKVLIEKLLRTTEVECIYILIREKRGNTIQQRIENLATIPLFEKLLIEQPKALERLRPIIGDVEFPDLGISETDRKVLTTNVQVVIHGAATVRFDEALHRAVNINVRGTLLLLQLCQQMEHLQAFVYVSTAFSNCVVKNIEERFYPEHLNCSAKQVLKLNDELNNQLFDNMEPVLREKYPNTYTYTKALAEQVIQEHSKKMPLCVFRPGVVLVSYSEPMPGWIDNIYGPIASTYGMSLGLLRVSSSDLKSHLSTVPVDYTANAILACAWKTAMDNSIKIYGEPAAEALVYNYTPNEQNPVTYKECINLILTKLEKYPFTQMLWFPFLVAFKTRPIYKVMIFLLHTIPAFLMDSLLRLLGKKPRLLKLYKKIHTGSDLIQFFATNTWYFDMRNTQQLEQSMSKEDRRLFQFDMTNMDWDEYNEKILIGVRMYLAKEGPETIERGKKLYKRFKIAHYTLIFIGSCLGIFLLWSFLKFLL